MVLPDSRYAAGVLSVVDDPVRGQHQALVLPPATEQTIQFTFYQITSEDTIDSLAFSLLGSGQHWWMIANANPEILDWAELVPGTVIRIPYV